VSLIGESPWENVLRSAFYNTFNIMLNQLSKLLIILMLTMISRFFFLRPEWLFNPGKTIVALVY
jgi:hypothetical protein